MTEIVFPLPETLIYNEKLLRQWRVLEAAIDGMHMQHEVDYLKEIYDEMDDVHKPRLDVRLLKLKYTLKNCDDFLISALSAPISG